MLEPVVDDHLLLAAEEPEVAVGVGAGEVAGVEPLVAHHLCGRLRRLPVASHAAAGADPDPAHRLRRDRLAVIAAQGDAVTPVGGPIEPCRIPPEGGFRVASPTSVIL
jgi:hypothetical protein